MLFFNLIALYALPLFGVRRRDSQSDGDYLSVEQTNAVRGWFAALILLSHMTQYLKLTFKLDLIAAEHIGNIGQLMVAPFLFYSGYGVMLSWLTKPGYATTFPKHRILRTWFHFVVAVTAFLFLDLVLGIRFGLRQLIVSYIGWDSLGNSNWYVFDTLVLYVLAWLLFVVIDKANVPKDKKGWVFVATISLCTAVFMFLLRAARAAWWYDTLACFPFGCAIYLAKDRIDKLLRSRLSIYLAVLLLSYVFASMSYRVGVSSHRTVFNICACLFVWIVSMLTMKLRIQNAVLAWLGKYSFYTYIYMRIPMIALQHFGVSSYVEIFVPACIVLTFLLSRAMKSVTEKLDSVIFTTK